MAKRKQTGSPHRVIEAAKSRFVVAAFCSRVGLGLRVLNDDQHWIVTGGDIRVEWWPSTAKAVRGKSDDRFKRKCHVATVEQFVDLIQQEIEANQPRVSRLKPDEAPVYPEQPTQTAMPTDWNAPRHEPRTTAVGGVTDWTSDHPVQDIVGGAVQTKPEPTITIGAARYAELLKTEHRFASLKSGVDFLIIVGLIAVLAGVLVYGINWAQGV